MPHRTTRHTLIGLAIVAALVAVRPARAGLADDVTDALVPDALVPDANLPDALVPDAGAPDASVDAAVEASADAPQD